MKLKFRLLIPFFLILLIVSCSVSNKQSMDVLVFLNSKSPEVSRSYEYLIPYLDHFGMAYSILDLGVSPIPENIADYALVVFAHPDIANGIDINRVIHLLRSSTANEAGIVTFDPGISFSGKRIIDIKSDINWMVIKTSDHYITSSHRRNDTLKFYNPFSVNLPDTMAGQLLIESNGKPLLIAEETNDEKIVTWTSMDWMHSDIFGPVRGLDDCLWKSFVWAARKPFFMHSLPPVVTMRIDDVAGRGGLWDESPLYWVKTANKYGFRPWLGLFIYNLNPDAINELRSYLINSQATAFPHAFGRPNRYNNRMESYVSGNSLDTVPFYYYPDAIPYRADSYDEFIYYDHLNARPWPDEEAIHGLNAVQDWYNAHQPLPISSCLIPHWYEMGTNCAGFVKEKWDSEFSCFVKPADKPYTDSVQWIVSGPFRLYEEPGSSTGWTRPGGQRPVYYADFMDIGDFTFFNSITEIRDDAGYEWAPDNNVEATVGRGVRQLERAMNSLALAILFTHETDYIYRIEPGNWDLELKGISEGIAEYQPRYMLLDDALRLVRTYHTSRPESASFNTGNGYIKIHFTGYSDTSSSITLFTEDENRIITEYVNIKPFKKNKAVKFKLLTNFRN